MNIRVSIIAEIYAKAELYDPDTMYFREAIKDNDAKHFE